MSRTIRRGLFLGAFLVFLLATYVAVLYAQGYKYSLAQGQFFRTGAIALKANADADVFIEGKRAGSTSFLTNSFSIDGLLPDQYTIRLEHENFSSWEKKVAVQEGLVIDFPHILIIPASGSEREKLMKDIEELFPKVRATPTPSVSPLPTGAFYVKSGNLYQMVIQDAEPELIAKQVVGFALTENERKLAWWTRNELWVQFLSDTDYQPIRRKDDRELITRFSQPIKTAAWFRGEDHLVVDSGGYRIVETDTRGGVNIISL